MHVDGKNFFNFSWLHHWDTENHLNCSKIDFCSSVLSRSIIFSSPEGNFSLIPKIVFNTSSPFSALIFIPFSFNCLSNSLYSLQATKEILRWVSILLFLKWKIGLIFKSVLVILNVRKLNFGCHATDRPFAICISKKFIYIVQNALAYKRADFGLLGL